MKATEMPGYIAKHEAFKDIREDLEKQNVKIFDGRDVWYVSGNFLDTKETRQLNRQLGLNSIHRFKH